MIPAYRRHTVRCMACAAPDVAERCARCAMPFCDVHAPEPDRRCGPCEAQWAFGEELRRGFRDEILQPLAFAVAASALFVAGVVGWWPTLSFVGAAVALIAGAYAPRLEAQSARRSFLHEGADAERGVRR